jgi:opacity protein-like surface antigen
MAGVIAALVCLLFLIPILAEGSALKIKVTAVRANIRVKPSLDGAIMMGADNGQIFEVIEKLQDWYLIKLPGDQKGYVSRTVVEEIAEGAAVPTEQPKPVDRPVTPQRPKIEPRRPAAQPAASRYEPTGKKFYIRLGGGMASKKFSFTHNWQFDLYYETGAVTGNYDIDASGFTLDAGLGFLLTENIGLEISYVPASGKTAAFFTAVFPHPFFFEDYREKAWEDSSLKYSTGEVNFDLILRYPIMSRLAVYATGGGTYFTGVKIDTLKTINYNENGYPYDDLDVTPEYSSYTKSAFGFNFGGGIDYFVTPSIGVNVNVRYVMGEVKIPVEGQEITIKPGGLRACGGIKFAF